MNKLLNYFNFKKFGRLYLITNDTGKYQFITEDTFKSLIQKNELPEDVYKTYFENLMYRLILNNGSHRLEQTQSMSDMYFFTVISDSEKQRTAKEILCFIYLLNKKHLLSHLEGCTDIESNLQHWCNDIKNSCLM